MSAFDWIALGSLAFTVAAAVVGSAIRLTWWLSEHFAEVNQRLAAVEAKLATIIKNGNGGCGSRRAGRARR